MNLRVTGSLVLAAFAITGILGSAQSLAQNAYITNEESNTVSVIDTAINQVTATIPVNSFPFGVAVSPGGSRVYVAISGAVSVIDVATNTVTATIPVGGPPGLGPVGVAVSPDGSKVYVTLFDPSEVSVIDTATNTAISVQS